MKFIIIWDFSGVQNYLFDIKKNKSATKRLKWRSVFIEMLLEKIKDDLKKKLWNCEDYLVSWWKFILICENFEKEKFNEFKKEIEGKLFKQFYWELKIIFWNSEIDWDFKIALNRAYEEVEKNKLKAFENVFIENGKWDEKMFVFEEDRWTDKVCKFSRGDLIKIKKWFDWYIDDILEEEVVDGIWLNTANDIIISNFVTDNKWWKNEIKIFDENLKIDEKYKKDLPKNKDWKIKSFEELAQWWKFNKLAVLKWDIDNLWEIFQFWLKEENYKENYKKLSEILDNFWKKELYKIIENKDLYVVYAGWDDFVILWRWDMIIEFYKDLLEKFKEYLKNSWVNEILDWKTYEDIHFSGAINLFGPHDTFFTIIKQAENLLEEAKNWEKNQVNIFWEVLKNEDFTKNFEEAKKFEGNFVKTDTVSIWTLRFLLNIAKKKILEDNDWKNKNWDEKVFFEYWTWRAELFYHLGRNYKTKNWDSLKDEFRKYIDWMLLWNEVWENRNLEWDRLKVLMSLILYWDRDKK